MTHARTLAALVLLLLTQTSFIAAAQGQRSAVADPGVRVTVASFKKLEGSARVDFLTRVLPGVLAAALWRYDWIEVESDARSEPPVSLKGRLPERNVAIQRTPRPRFALEGTLIERAGNIRLDLNVMDEGGAVLLSDFEISDEASILLSVNRLAERVATQLRERVVSAQRPRGIVYFVERPFANKGEGRYAFVGSAVVQSLIAENEKGRREKTTLRAGAAAERGSYDALISGEYAVRGNEISVSSRVTERSGLSFVIQLRGTEKEITQILKMHSERVLEIMDARVAEDGQWRDQPALLFKASASDFVSRGDDSYRAKDYQLAVLSYRKALEQDPTSAEAIFGLVDVYRAQQKYERALIEVMQATNVLRPSATLSYVQGLVFEDLKQWEQAIGSFEKAYALNTAHVATLIHLGYAHIMKRDYDAAIDRLEKAATLAATRREKSEALLYLGTARKGKGDLVTAIAKFDEAAAIEARPKIYMELARAYQERGNAAMAVSSASRALELDPQHVPAYQLVSSLVDRATYREALQVAVRREPTFTWAVVELGITELQLGNYTQAVSILKKALSQNPSDVTAHISLGAAYQEMEDYQQARVHYGAAIELKPSGRAYVGLSDCYREVENFVEAEKYAREAIKLDGNYVWSHMALSNVYNDRALRGSKELHGQAAKVIEDAIRTVGAAAPLYLQLAYTYRLAKDYPKAEQLVRKALDISPNDASSQMQLAWILLEQDRLDEAERAMEGGLRLNPRSAAAPGLIRQIYVKRREPQKAAQVLQAMLDKDPGYAAAANTLGYVYHEHLYNFRQAYEVYDRLVQAASYSVTSPTNLAEASLTTGRFDTAVERANQLLTDPNLNTEQRLSMRFVVISSLMFQPGKRANAFAELGGFIRGYRSLPTDYNRSWEFRGSKRFISTTKRLESAEKNLLLNLIDILESKTKKEGDQKAEELEASLQGVLKKMQANNRL